MFVCKRCGSKEFRLEVQAQFRDQMEISINEHDETVVRVGTREIVADLLFMNQFAICGACGGIKQWEYDFPKEKSLKKKS